MQSDKWNMDALGREFSKLFRQLNVKSLLSLAVRRLVMMTEDVIQKIEASWSMT